MGNPVEIRDWRDPADWPVGAKPVTKKIEYDDLYRATRIKYEYSDGDDAWVSPFAAENSGDVGGAEGEGPKRAKPSPHIGFDKRILEQTFQYDWVGNNKKTGDDADGFYDRSLGDITNDSASDKPYQLRSAELGGARGGELEARCDDAGNMVKMALQRSGPCLGEYYGDCNQQFVYDWDEVGRLVRARRWDGKDDSVDTFNPNLTGAPTADLRYIYDASDQRVLKEAVDRNPAAGEQKSYTLYIFSSLELRRTQFGSEYVDAGNTGSDYELSHWTISPYLMANGVRLARLVYHGEDAVPEDGVASGGMPGDVNASTSQLHVFFELGDHLGSTSVVLDKATGELVERATFQGYGGAESDYRPGRWANFREDYRFTGKEEDVEVGLTYFGKRFLNPLLGRWVSADPLAIHVPGEADLNVYAYVSGHILKSVDPLGLDENSGCGAGDGCDVEPQESPTEETQANDTGTYSSGGASYNTPEEGQEAGTGQEGAPSNDTVKQGASGIVDVTPGMIAIGLINPVFGAALVVLGGAQTAQKDTPITPATPEFEQASANGQAGFQLAMSGLGGTASRAVTKSATRELGEASVQKLSQELDELGESVTRAMETTGSEAAKGAGGLVAQNGTKVTGYTKHGLNRAIGDGGKRAGTKASSIQDALKNPKSIKSGVDSAGRPFEAFKGDSARVVVNPETGQIVSVNPIGGAGVR